MKMKNGKPKLREVELDFAVIRVVPILTERGGA